MKTAQQVRQEMRAQGLTIAAWAAQNGFKPYPVRMVLCGRAKGHYGTAHRIAVMLGMKDGTIVG